MVIDYGETSFHVDCFESRTLLRDDDERLLTAAGSREVAPLDGTAYDIDESCRIICVA